MLTLHCTARLAKAAGIKLAPAPQGGTPHWLDAWYANLVPLSDMTQLVLLVNAASLYAIVVSCPVERLDLVEIVGGFKKRLDKALMSQGADMETLAATAARHAEFTACKTASRQVLGSMTEMAFALRHTAWRKLDATGTVSMGDLEDMLNEQPLAPLGWQFPVESFRQHLGG